MNIAIVKVVIQAFVDKHDLLRMPGSPEEQYGEVYGAAQDEGEEEVTELLDWLAEAGHIEILFRNK